MNLTQDLHIMKKFKKGNVYVKVIIKTSFWKGDHDSLNSFMTELNSNNQGVSFTYEASRENIHFLDST